MGGIGSIAPEPAMRWRMGRAQQPTAMRRESIEQGLDFLLREDVVSERECAGPSEVPLHVGLECRAKPRAQHHAVHLVEDDLRRLEHRLPAKTVAVKALRPRDVGDAKRNDRNLLLHDPRPFVSPARECAGAKSWGKGTCAPVRTAAGRNRGSAGLNHTGLPFSTG